MEYILKFGKATVNTSPTTIASFLNPGELYTYPTAAMQMYIVSDSADDTLSGDGARTVKISGLDGDYKEINEVIELNGTTPVASTKEYLRIYRMQVLTSGNVATTGTILAQDSGATVSYCGITDGNQSQMAAMTIPAGKTGIFKNILASVYAGKKINIFLAIREYGSDKVFNIKENWNLKNNILDHEYKEDIFTMPEKTDIEIRGYTESNTDTISASFHIDLDTIIKDSITPEEPILVANFNTTSGDKQVSLSWDAGNSDYLDIRWQAVGQVGGSTVIDGSETSTTIYGLENDVEYNFYIKQETVRGVSGPETSASATPGQAPAIPYTLGQGYDIMNGNTGGKYFITTDSGASWTENTLAQTGYENRRVAVIDAFSMISIGDHNDVNPGRLFQSTNGSSWTEVLDGNTYHDVKKVGDEIMRFDNINAPSVSTDNVTWNAVTGADSPDNGVKMGANYYIINGNDANMYSSSNGYTFAAMANQPGLVSYNGIFLANSATRLMLVSGNAETPTTLLYKYADGDVAWSDGGASTISGTSVGNTMILYFNGLFHVTASEADFSAVYYETSPDGVTWTDKSSSLPAGLLPVALGTDGTTMYMSLADGSFAGSIMTSSDGINWNTPVDTSDGTVLVTGISGK